MSDIPQPTSSAAWDFGDGTTPGPFDVFPSIQHTYTQPGTYTPVYSFIDADETAWEFSTTVTVTPGAELEVTLETDPSQGPPPLQVTFTASVSGGTEPFSYTFDFGDGSDTVTQDGATAQHTYQEAGSYTAQVTATDSLGTEGSAQVDITVASGLSVSLAADRSSGVAPLDVSFTATATGGTAPLAYTWDFGDGSSGQSQTGSITHTYEEAGSYTAQVTVTDSVGEHASATLPVSVSDVLAFQVETDPDPPQGLVSTEISAFTVKFFVVVSAGKEPFSYSYTFGDGSAPVTNSDQPEKAHNYTQAGTYQAKVTVTDSLAQTKEVTVEVVVKSEEEVNTEITTVGQADVRDAADFDALSQGVGQVATQVASVLNLVQNAPVGSTVRQNAEQTAKQAAEKITGQTKDLLDQFIPPSGSLSRAEAEGTFLADSSVSEAEVRPILDNTGDLMSKLPIRNLSLTATTFQNAGSASKAALRGLLDEALAYLGLSEAEIQDLLANPEQLGQLLEEKPQALDKVEETVSLLLGVPLSLKRDAVLQLVQNLNLGTSVTDAVKTSLPELQDVGKDLVEQTGQNPKDGLDFLTAALGVSRDQASVDSAGPVIVQGQTALGVTSMGIGPGSLPSGVHTLPDGTRLGVDSDVALRLAPAVKNPVLVSGTIAGLGLRPTLTSDGRLLLRGLTPRVTGVTGFSYNIESENTVQAGTVSFDVSGTDPASEAYGLLVRYGDGTFQSMPPMLMAEDAFLAVLEENIPGQYSLNRNTGVLDLSTAGLGRWKADFLFEELSEELASIYQSIRSAGGSVTEVGSMALEFADFNGDGRVDFRLYSPDPKGRQVLYALD
jgi:PKD repeat protein